MHELALSNAQVMPNEQVLNLFINNQESPRTKQTYGIAIRSFLALSGKHITEVTSYDALAFNESLKARYAPATVQRHVSTLNGFFSFAVKLEIIGKNPFSIVKQVGVPSRIAEKFLTDSELDRLLNALAEKGNKQYVLGLLLSSTGARISEIQQLSWCDFVLMPDNSVSLNLLRKGNLRQLLPLRQDVFEVVKQFMGKEIDQSDSSPIFLNPSKRRVSVVSLRAWVEDGCKRAKLPKHVTPHFLRHNFASTSLAAGASLRNVQEFMDHSSISTTQGYLHATDMKVGEFMPMTVKPLKPRVKS